MGARHGVNPTVFAVLYLIHHPLFWGTVAWIVVRVRKGLIVWPHAVMAAAFWLMPYTYIALNVKHVPWYIEVVGGGLLAFGLYRAVQEIRKKIQEIGDHAADNGHDGSEALPRPKTLSPDKAKLAE